MSSFSDTHCHLNLNSFEKDLGEVILRAESCSVTKILVPGIDLATSQQAVELSQRFDCVYAAVGIHPNEARLWNRDAFQQLLLLAKHPKVVAIGEIGLDFYHQDSTPESQMTALEAQLELAERAQKPVILHSRNALPTLFPILFKWRAGLSSPILRDHPGVLHAFEGILTQGHIAIEHGFCIGIGGPVTYKNAIEKHALASQLPLEKILLETDAPFLTPLPYRGQRNEPALILEIARKIALFRGEAVDEIGKTTSKAADLLFRWSFPL